MVELNEVKQAFANVPNTHITEVDSEGRYAQVTLSEKNAGHLFGIMRKHGFNGKRKRIGGNLVAFIELEEGSIQSKFDELFNGL